ncbi:MAG: hypothetical protein ACRC7V_06415 [Lachnospiraceae bacterium]
MFKKLLSMALAAVMVMGIGTTAFKCVMDKEIFKNRKRIIVALLCFLPFLVLYIISILFLDELYLFKWLANRWYLCLWFVAMILAFLQKHIVAISLTIGGILGAPLGQFLGDAMQIRNIQSITELMTQEEQARLHLHAGVPIWVTSVIIFGIVGIVIEILHNKQKLNFKKRSDL